MRPFELLKSCRNAALGTCATLALSFGSASAQPAGQEVNLSYDMYGGGLFLASFDATARTDDVRYNVTIDGRTRGVLTLMGDWRARATAAGYVEDGLRADWYQMNIYEDDETTTLRIDHLPGSRVETFRQPDRDLIAEVPVADRVGTLDPISALIGASLAQGVEPACPDVQEVFDGTRRYDVVFEEVGIEQIDASSVGGFVGSAMHCRMRVEPVSGHWRDPDSRSFWRYPRPGDDPYRMGMEVWFAPPVEGAPATMVRAQRDIDFLGRFLIHLVDASVTPQSQIAAQ
ncbi:MAG: DUF3108 domain-containing protein [Pseudomonadota bacterium]